MKTKNLRILIFLLLTSLAILGATCDKSITINDIGSPANGLVAYYPFNRNANDESGNGNNGVMYSYLTNTQTNDFTSNGKFGYGALFNGNVYIKADSLKKIQGNNNAFSISAWIKHNDSADGLCHSIVTKSVAYSDQNGDFVLQLSELKRIRFCVWSDGWKPGWNWEASTATINSEAWNHIVATHSISNGIRVYLNGNLLGINNNVAYNNEATNHSIEIGSQGYNGGGSVDRFNGTIDEVRIFNRSLSEPEIQQLYNSQ